MTLANKFLLLSISFLFFCCKPPKNSTILVVEDKQKPTIETIRRDEKIKVDSALSPQNSKTSEPVKEKNSIENELIKLQEETERIIQNNQEIPSFRVDSSAAINLVSLFCDSLSLSNVLQVDFINTFKESSIITQKTDGSIFCLKELLSDSNSWIKIIYGRNEGGHTTDKVSLVSFNKSNNTLHHLPLTYKSMWDGHETEVLSEISGNTITRKITNRYGWANLDEVSQSKQARRVVTQVVKFDQTRRMTVLNETIEKFNY